MATRLEGIPEALAAAELDQGAVSLLVDEALYPLEALYGASYVFIDRCFVLLDRPEPGRVRVTLSPKAGRAEEALLRELVGEFSNELLSCAWRHRITQENRGFIESVTQQAIAGAMGPPSLDELASFDFTQEPFEDPLGIAVSWEEKYRKKEEPTEAKPESGEKVG